MDASTKSSMTKALSSKEASASAEPEESGWTTYFDDSFASQKMEELEASPKCSPSIDDHIGTSVISDAASCAAWEFRAGAESPGRTAKTRSRKTKSIAAADDSLEDTATSPVTSPKELGDGFEKFTGEQRRKERDGLGLADESANECIDLKKKGLCLVPLSMFVLSNKYRRNI